MTHRFLFMLLDSRFMSLSRCCPAQADSLHTQFLCLSESNTGRSTSLPRCKVEKDPIMIIFFFAREKATLSLRKSCRSLPALPSSLLLTREIMIADLSRPWYLSIVLISSPLFRASLRLRLSFKMRSWKRSQKSREDGVLCTRTKISSQ